MLIPVERDAASTSIRAESTIDPATVWGRTAPLIVEIGSGQFGDVCKATYTDPSGAEFLVAVKTVRDTAASVAPAPATQQSGKSASKEPRTPGTTAVPVGQ